MTVWAIKRKGMGGGPRERWYGGIVWHIEWEVHRLATVFELKKTKMAEANLTFVIRSGGCGSALVLLAHLPSFSIEFAVAWVGKKGKNQLYTPFSLCL